MAKHRPRFEKTFGRLCCGYQVTEIWSWNPVKQQRRLRREKWSQFRAETREEYELSVSVKMFWAASNKKATPLS